MSGRILLVEDEPSIAAIIAFKLGREGHQVQVLEAAPAHAPDPAPDLVIAEAAQAEACGRVFRDTPLMVLFEPRTETCRVGIPMPKPFKPTVLARLVGEILARAPG